VPSAKEDLELAQALADLADATSMQRFRTRGLEVSVKPDGTPVTNADRAVEDVLRHRIRHSRPNDRIIGEDGGSQGVGTRRWYLDPIDGTTRFIDGDVHWRALIALEDPAGLLLGVITAPALGRRWWALRDHGAYRDGKRLAVTEVSRLASAIANDDWVATLARGVRNHPLAVVAAHCAGHRSEPDHSFIAIAEGLGDVAVGVGGQPWDYAAMKILVEEAGGRFTDLHGRASIASGHALASNGKVHDEALARLAAGWVL
jgi:histidinol-phosphatase